MYSKENMADLSLNIEHGNLFDESDAPDQTAVHEGITLKYSQDHYLSLIHISGSGRLRCKAFCSAEGNV